MYQKSFNDTYRDRTRSLALRVIREVNDIKNSDTVNIIRKQLVKSVTSTAANFRAVCRARSEKEKYAKLCIVVEEVDETLFWLDLFKELGFILPNKASSLIEEAEQILKVMSSFRSKLKASNAHRS